MFLDGDKVEVKDRVFHVSAGYGVVETIDARGRFARVRMADGGVLEMRDGGFSGIRKMFYWYDPPKFTPRKGQERNQMIAIELVDRILTLVQEQAQKLAEDLVQEKQDGR